MPIGSMTTLKDVLHEVVRQSPLPTKQLAEELGIAYSMLMNAANPDQPEFRFQARLIVPLTKLTGDTRLVEYIAQACGLVVLKLPEVPSSMGEIHSELAKSSMEFGELVAELGEAMKDGHIDSGEAKKVEKEGRELMQQVSALLVKVRESVTE